MTLPVKRRLPKSSFVMNEAEGQKTVAVRIITNQRACGDFLRLFVNVG